MSENFKNQKSKSINPARTIEVGNFYLIYDGSPTGHPGFVISKDDDKNLYLVLRLDSDKPGESTKESRGVRHITKLRIQLVRKLLIHMLKIVLQCANEKILVKKH